ncbi:MAG: molybdopterin molybdotransferase MoeA [Rhodospirillaceae bacterium]|nr:molybdopterin molybdotransferase MoeA [Rhodospirillaceae bacterium]
MTQLSDDCFEFGGEMLPVAEALARLEPMLAPVVEAESVHLAQALGRILAEDLVSTEAVPPHDNSAVDGYAVYFDDLSDNTETTLPVGGTVAAGHPLDRQQVRGEAIRIFTGAPMPFGEGSPAPDTVFMQEDCRAEGENVVLPAGIKRGANRRFAGEDVKPGDRVLSQGNRLRPQDIGIAAAVGNTELQVYRPLKAAVFSTGDEVQDPGAARQPGAIFDSNRYSVSALLAGMGCLVTDLGILPDDLGTIQAALDQASDSHDVIVTSGGVSVGGEDHVKTAVEALGQLHLWRLAIKPGRPIAFGQVGRVPFVGLPGNPVAVMVTFLRVARPVLLKLAGARSDPSPLFPVRAGFAYEKKAGRREYLRARIEMAPGRAPTAHKFERDGAGVLSSMVAADGLVELAEDITTVAEGDMVDYLPFSEVGL